MYRITKDDWRYGRDCTCSVPVGIHREQRGCHHWWDCPKYDAPADTRLADEWYARVERAKKEVWH